ncbi:hypothetical protein N658DRAFT_345916 [Parathielavia hyrcaniae]|uniref:Uncharacterized protein n=1 Tax=Parathielavia hyrcaniae TaxID=113614 RepID=A0AAN6PRK7_9PEZI|nr:hypothetical protein N658DRAFT_345916 [Parathielavia hyrcaniae]
MSTDMEKAVPEALAFQLAIFGSRATSAALPAKRCGPSHSSPNPVACDPEIDRSRARTFICRFRNQRPTCLAVVALEFDPVVAKGGSPVRDGAGHQFTGPSYVYQPCHCRDREARPGEGD